MLTVWSSFDNVDFSCLQVDNVPSAVCPVHQAKCAVSAAVAASAAAQQ